MAAYKKPTTQELIDGILSGDRFKLSRAITLVESTNPKHQQQAQDIIEACLPKSGRSIRVGVTGVPGVGKSTFIEALGQHLTAQGHKLAVLAVDPTSSVSGGSILGDKTRMEKLSNNPNAFIRPSASGETVGGVARKTRESIYLCEAAGYDVILVETVGVGQSGVAVHGMVDFFLLLMLAGAGDELQGMKRGIMEMADAVVINKADGDNKKPAEQARMNYKHALHLFPAQASKWTPQVLTCSSTEGTHIDLVWEKVEDYITLTRENGYLQQQRQEQNAFWLKETIDQRLRHWFYGHEAVRQQFMNLNQAVRSGDKSSFAAADLLMKNFIEAVKKES